MTEELELDGPEGSKYIILLLDQDPTDSKGNQAKFQLEIQKHSW